jgi:hypothetical protein
MMNIGKIIGLVVFFIVLILQFYVSTNGNLSNVITLFKNSINQFTNVLNIPQPTVTLYLTSNNAIFSFNNTADFQIILLNATGKYTYLPKPVTLLPKRVTNVTISVTDWKGFLSAVETRSYNITFTFKLFNTTFIQSEII